jgi:tRNA/rRNA methyltransferase
VVVAYEWFKLAGGGLPFGMPQKSQPAPKQQLIAFFEKLESELERVEYFRPQDKHGVMQVNLRNIFQRMEPTKQDIQTLNGVLTALAEGRKGPARGGVLDGAEAEMLRAMLDEYERGRVVTAGGPARGLAKLLRRNPTDAERAFWAALTKDRRFAGRGFKRQVPVGQNIVDFVSFPLRIVIDLIPEGESEVVTKTRTDRRAWLVERGYRVIDVHAADVEKDVAKLLNDLDKAVGAPSSID